MLIAVVGYILVKGIPNLNLSMFAWKYTTDNVSMMPAIINTLSVTAVALLIAVPFGIFSAIYLVEYAKRGNKLVNLIRLTTETLSGIPSIVYGLFWLLDVCRGSQMELFYYGGHTDTGNHDIASDYENDRRSFESCAGFF